jgi:hypothetical protein
MTEEDIKAMFGTFGGVVAVTIVKDQLNRSKGFGFVEVRLINVCSIHTHTHTYTHAHMRTRVCMCICVYVYV